MTLTQESFSFVATLVRTKSAINLAPGKEYLVESRLTPIARSHGKTVEQYLAEQRSRLSHSEAERIVEALTTNETSWFRDNQPFTALTDHILPDLKAQRGMLGTLKVWSAACSTGQEPYSIAMVLTDWFTAQSGPKPITEIIATDLNQEVLGKAQRGRYSQLEVNRGLPATHLVRHFERDGAEWALSKDIRSMVRFTRHNLLDHPPMGGPFDVVFLRNVLIYFDVQVKRDVLAKVRKVLKPGGYLILGAAETTVGVDDSWTRVQVGRSSIYQNTVGK
ncbi:CheR family methyltransferase [Jonesia denitrificans]|jgi:chemotaxis protein methyltransferase CheR|uniref:protein-glutamate O-methyltransferase n=1 Tax=Jonesia denitrificans (strain ATCC 14870 / DSM 20603 / BCRC 15368 / CIP 55.134 / JCM 11481 / NBRC 15587 / NCTC 10816 / Prevot 55134) TaxID=471856 RepID=C7R0H5_JONDD|nr:protein-glutamate O-methyltransferase CheR [Jonesia denitrificans]ACV09639.1 MCP methyltransferase, CheR-type [Jonesia denitrificans DSM 20603]ASE09141.1 protein-glutamate O-methyltransferase CheR [Jonesia denitrificans]QXB43684.1 protein-glutamate O-methyltransferase CheR [Jonesia denitrificans]SQH22134.1 Chemotaxis protein methyltransferase [Jonesia denitrificans]